MGSQRVRHDWATELNLSEPSPSLLSSAGMAFRGLFAMSTIQVLKRKPRLTPGFTIYCPYYLGQVSNSSEPYLCSLKTPSSGQLFPLCVLPWLHPSTLSNTANSPLWLSFHTCLHTLHFSNLSLTVSLQGQESIDLAISTASLLPGSVPARQQAGRKSCWHKGSWPVPSPLPEALPQLVAFWGLAEPFWKIKTSSHVRPWNIPEPNPFLGL